MILNPERGVNSVMSAGLNFFEMILFIGIHIKNFTEQNLDILTIEDNYHLHHFEM